VEVATGSWQVDSVPLTAIGISSGDPRYELDQANSAVRLADGRIAIANSGTHELRFYDASGGVAGVSGRDGDGPGEYRGAMAVYTMGPDSLVVYANGNQRYSVLDSLGRYAHTIRVTSSPAEPFPWDDWLTSSTWVRGVRDPSLRPCAARVLQQLPQPDSVPVRRAIVDDLHAVWVQPASQAEAAAEWTVLPGDGKSALSVTLPGGVELYQAGKDFILGRRLNDEGVEQIVVYRLRGRSAAQPAACDAGAASGAEPVAAADQGTVSRMQAELRNFIVSEEMYFAMHGSYAESADSTAWRSETGSRMWLVRADRRGWFGFLRGPGESGVLCASGVGDALPPGWDQGAARCEQAIRRPEPAL
jgi:hypothetical protein